MYLYSVLRPVGQLSNIYMQYTFNLLLLLLMLILAVVLVVAVIVVLPCGGKKESQLLTIN